MAHYVYEGVHYELPDGLSNEQAVDKIKMYLGQGANKTAPSSDWVDTAKDIGKKYVGAREAELSFLSGMGAQIPAAVGAGLSAMNDLTAGRDVKFKDAYENILHGLTYEPKTDEGKDIADDIGKSGFMQSMNAVGGVAHTMPPLTIRPSVRGAIPKSAKSPVDIALENIEKQRQTPTSPKSAYDQITPEQFQQQALYNREGQLPPTDRRAPEINRGDMTTQQGLPFDAGVDEIVRNRYMQDFTNPDGVPMQRDMFAEQDLLNQDRDSYAEKQQNLADEQSRQQQLAQQKQAEIEQAFAEQEAQKQQVAKDTLQAERDDALAQLQETLSVPRNSKGQQRKAMAGRKNQRGAIDVEAVSDAIDKFKNGVGDALNVLRSFKGTFNDVEMQLAEKAMSSETSRDHVVLMSPDEFHQLAAERFPGWTESKIGGAETKRGFIREGLQSEKGLHDMPYLLYDKNGKVISHEGRHRMDVFKEQGIGLVPVRIRGYDGRALPEKLIPEDNEFRSGGQGIATPRPIRLPQAQRGGINLDVFKNEKKTKAIEEVLNTKLYAPEVKAADVISQALAAGKDSSGSVNFSAGGTLEGMKRNSPLVTGGVRIVQRWLNIADDKIRTNVIPVEKAFRGLKPNEVIDLGKVFIKEMFAKEEFSSAELASIGLSDKQLIAYNQMRNIFEKALQDINESRIARGLKPVSRQEAYLSSRWRGDFRRAIYDKEGNLAWYLAAETKKGLDRQTQALMKDFPELVPGEHLDHIKGSGRYKTTSTGEMYLAMKDFLGADNERVKALEQWYHEQVKLDSEGAYAQTKHFIHKGNIRGFVGDRPGVAGTKAEALAMFQEQINYAKNAHKWAAITRAGNELKSIFSNEELNKQQPKNMAYAREYFENQVGLNTWDAVRAVEDSLHNIGTSIHEVKKITNAVKSAWILQKIGGSLGYVSSQVLQSTNMLPHLVNAIWKEKANPLILPAAFIQGTSEGLLMATGHLMKQSDNLIKSAKYRPGDSVFSAKAMKYAEDNGIITRSLTDESPIESSFSKTGRALKAANWTLSTPEAYLRSVVYMTYTHAYKMIGKLPELEVFRKAEELTNASMGDYRSGERAPIFSKMGAAGDVANILQTYPVNFYNQYSWAAREAGRLNPVPIFAMLGTHYLVAGMMGIPGFQDLDKLWTWTKKQIADRDPDLWMKVKDLDLKELAIKTLGKSGLYGAVSIQSGISMTSRAAAPAGSEMLVNPAAPYVDMAQQLGSLGNAAVKRDAQSVSQAALDLAPVGVQGALETGPLKNQTSVVNSKGERIYGKTTDLAAREGMIKRTPQEERLRSLGFRSQREVEEREAAYKAKAKEQQALSVARQLPDKAWNAIRNGDKEKTREYVKLYSQIMGTQMTEDMFSKRALDEYTTAAEKVQIKNKTIPGLVALKQLKDIIKEENVSK